MRFQSQVRKPHAACETQRRHNNNLCVCTLAYVFTPKRSLQHTFRPLPRVHVEGTPRSRPDEDALAISDDEVLDGDNVDAELPVDTEGEADGKSATSPQEEKDPASVGGDGDTTADGQAEGVEAPTPRATVVGSRPSSGNVATGSSSRQNNRSTDQPDQVSDGDWLAKEAWGRLEMLCVVLSARALRYDAPTFPSKRSEDRSVLAMPQNMNTAFRPPRRGRLPRPPAFVRDRLACFAPLLTRVVHRRYVCSPCTVANHARIQLAAVFSYYAPILQDGSDVSDAGPFRDWASIRLLNPLDGAVRQPNESVADLEHATRFLDRALDMHIDWDKKKREERQSWTPDPNAYVVGSTVMAVPLDYKR